MAREMKDYCLTQEGKVDSIAVEYLTGILDKRLQKKCPHPEEALTETDVDFRTVWKGTGQYVGKREKQTEEVITLVSCTCSLCNKKIYITE
jgi:anti-sigma-K factor RskA